MPNLGPQFYPKLVQIASELGMKPEDILAIMVSESGINPASYEKKYHGAGLVGFMPDTLKNLGYTGQWSDFIKLQGQDQLDYVKKLINNNAKFNGGPFTSAAQYYVANFWPVALHLPGIKSGDASTVFVEENPATITDPKTGKKWSKKYYDLGYKISPYMEKSAYKENPLFHGSTSGAITYGDMMRQVDKNRQNPMYRQAIADMKNTTGYQATEHPAQQYATNAPHQSSFDNFMAKLTNLLNKFVSASSKNNYLISVGSSSDYTATMEYARILSTALQEYFDAKTTICANENNIEIECKVNGNQKIMFDAIKELSTGISDAFGDATIKLGTIATFSLITTNSKSEYDILHPRQADLYSRKFRLKFARIQ